MEFDLVFRSRRVVRGDEPSAAAAPADVGVQGEVIAAVESYGSLSSASVVDLGDDALLPGLVDTHVHLNDPGRAEWEGFESGTRSAAAGGITTVVDMPLNSVPATTTLAGWEEKRRSMEGKLAVDVGCWGGIVPGNLGELRPLADAGVLGFKAFLVDSGVDEFPAASIEELSAAAPLLVELDLPLLVHAESSVELLSPSPGSDPLKYETYLATRPPRSEIRAIEELLALAESSGVRLHVVHLATEAALPMLEAARARGVRVTVETCPHYLSFASDEIADGALEFKCAPPVRSFATAAALWDALGRSAIDAVVTDHSPAPPKLKQGDFLSAWGGIASLQVALSAVWTEARRRGYELRDIARWMAEAPAALAGLKSKGRIEPGLDADLIVFSPEEEFVVDASRLYHRHPITPYDGATLCGRVRSTYLRGEPVDFDTNEGPRRGKRIDR